MSRADDYFLQRVPHKCTGKLETDRPYRCRQEWVKHDFPSFEELSSLCGVSLNSINTYSKVYGWKGIRQKFEDIRAEIELEAQKQRQEDTLKLLDGKNDKRLALLDKQLDEIEDKLTDLSLTDEERAELRKEQRDIIKEYHNVQVDKLRTVNLPAKLNDKQEHQHKGVVDLDLHLKAFLE